MLFSRGAALLAELSGTSSTTEGCALRFTFAARRTPLNPWDTRSRSESRREVLPVCPVRTDLLQIAPCEGNAVPRVGLT